jgi:hypothetical protein
MGVNVELIFILYLFINLGRLSHYLYNWHYFPGRKSYFPRSSQIINKTREDLGKNRFSASPCVLQVATESEWVDHPDETGKNRGPMSHGVARLLIAQRPSAPSIGLYFTALHRQWRRLHASK